VNVTISAAQLVRNNKPKTTDAVLQALFTTANIITGN
jgi:hypothetical protein